MTAALSRPQKESEAPAPPSAPPAPLTIDEVRALAELAREYDLTEVELVRPSGERLRLRRGAQEQAPRAPAPALQRAPSGQQQAQKDEAAAADLRYITSPFVGTFYRAAGPEVASFVEAGQKVRKAQTLCIIEAMKLMNELEAEFDCVIVECLVDNGRAVEYGQRLFSVRPG